MLRVLEENCEIVTESGCWLWMGATVRGYGQVTRNSKHKYVHRLSYETYIEDIPKGKHVLHTCDVRCCCNPDHLFIGDNNDNIADKVSKNRQAKGSDLGKSALSENDIREIRLSRFKKLKLRELASLYGVSIGTISDIVKFRTWRHVN